MSDPYAIIDKIMGQLTLEQKVGQLFTQAFYGSMITPDTVRTIKDLNCGGLRITQFFRGFRRYAKAGEDAQAFERVSPADLTPNLIDDRKDVLCKPPYLTVKEYTQLLADVQAIAAERPYDIPLHMMLDCEANGGDAPRDGVHPFPSQFGYARCGDTQLAYDVTKAIAKQLSAIGFNIINSPCVDVCFDPSATYIRVRSFSHKLDEVCDMAVAAMKGFKDGGLIPCAKHFPGRGATAVDAHHDVGAIDKSDEDLYNEDLLPYRKMIAEGLPAIMVGHSIYPAWDPDNIASVSEKVINGILRERLQFKGMITTDSMIMGAIAKKYGVPQGCVLAIKAGASAVLMKECGPIREEAYRLSIEAVKSGEISEDHIDDLVIRNLKAKIDCGLYGDNRPDPEKAEKVVRSPEIADVARRAAEEAVHVIRDTTNALPLDPSIRTLLVEEVAKPHLDTNDKYAHPGMFWDEIKQHSDQVSLLEIQNSPVDEDLEKIETYCEFYDRIIFTYYKNKGTVCSGKMIDKLLEQGKEVIVVSSTPLPYELPDHWPTVICTYGVMRPVLKVAAALLYGKFTPKQNPRPRPWEAEVK